MRERKPRLKQKYYDEVRDELQKQFNYGNVMQIPRFEKIVVNMGVGEAATDSKAIDGAIADLRAITGQQPLVTHARKSIATFHLRAGQAIGAKVTLRGDRMWEFLDRLIAVAIPRIRDFRGLSPKSFDGRGNYSMGVTERLRQDRPHARHGHHHRDHRSHRRGGQGASRRLPLPVQGGVGQTIAMTSPGMSPGGQDAL